MSPREIVWRMSQKALQINEKRRFGKPRAVTEPLYPGVSADSFSTLPLGLTAGTGGRDTSTFIRLPGGFPYARYATDWHAGFNTDARWPLTWAYDLDYKQCDEIGDARINWELNRHRQFVRLAMAYASTGDAEFLDTLSAQFTDWVEANPFLIGISWTSPMEIAIRSLSWMYTVAFLRQGRREARVDTLTAALLTGVANMTAYLLKHYSRYSSANNHLLVEMLAIGTAGLCFGRDEWSALALETLDRELYLQNSPDGVNLEMSLHYHAFVMEVYLLMIHSLRTIGRREPSGWTDMLGKMASFVAHSIVADGVTCAFGDDDEGHIADFSTGSFDYYRYILQLSSLILGRRYDAFDNVSPTLTHMFAAADIERMHTMPLYDTSAGQTFAEGGYSFLRSPGGSVFVGVDHAPLGFGSIAAHGHADALSFQLYADGKPLLIDPGTYIYHINLDMRNAFRSTLNHNTLTINDVEQSQMLGAFLWGEKAVTELLEAAPDSVTARVTGLSGIGHTRTVRLKGDDGIIVTDRLDEPCPWIATLMVHPGVEVKVNASRVTLDGRFEIRSSAGRMKVEKGIYSPAYGVMCDTPAIRIYGDGTDNTIEITRI